MDIRVRVAFRNLKLPETATLEECKKSYRKLSLIHHPDRGGNADMFNMITDAWNTVKAYHEGKFNIPTKSRVVTQPQPTRQPKNVCRHKDLMHFYVRKG